MAVDFEGTWVQCGVILENMSYVGLANFELAEIVSMRWLWNNRFECFLHGINIYLKRVGYDIIIFY